ncbi:7785_t:CDS:2, partial [Gigaspora margarita]
DLTTETPFEDSVTDDLTSKIHGFETNDVDKDDLVNTIDVHDEEESDEENKVFNYLTTIRKIAYTEQKQNPRQKYGFGLGYTKKALDYAFRANNIDNFINYLEKFIEKTKVELDKLKENNNINYIGDIEDLIRI